MNPTNMLVQMNILRRLVATMGAFVRSLSGVGGEVPAQIVRLPKLLAANRAWQIRFLNGWGGGRVCFVGEERERRGFLVNFYHWDEH